MKMTFVLLIFALASSPWAVPAPLAVVRPLEVESRAAISDPQLRTTLEHLNLHPIDSMKSQQLKPFHKRIADLIGSLLEEKDGSDPIDFVLVDDARPNAAFFESPTTGKRVVFLNVGTLKFVKNDDELAYILSHELEHRTAALQGHADAATGRVSQSLYQRAVENEVDAKGAVGRLEKHGYNPYAAIDFLARMEQLNPSELSETHSSTASRKHTTSLALVYQAREGGAESKLRMEPEKRTSLIIKDVQQILSSPAYESETRIRLKNFAASPPAKGVEDLYREVIKATPGLQTNGTYAKKFKEVLAAADRLGLRDLSREAQVDFQLDLHNGLSNAFHAARTAALPETFRANTQEQFELLRDLDRRPIVIDVPDLFTAASELKRAEKWLSEIKRDLDIDSGKGHTSEALSTAEKELAEKQAAYRDAKLAFTTIPHFDEQVDKTLAENRASYSLQQRPEDYEKNGFAIKRSASSVRENAERTKALHAAHEKLIFAKKGHVNRLAAELESVYLLSDRAKQLTNFFDRYLQQMNEDIAAKSSIKEKSDYPYSHLSNWWSSQKGDSRNPRQALADLHELSPRESSAVIKRLLAQAEAVTLPEARQSILKLFLQSLPISTLKEAEVEAALEKFLGNARIDAIGSSVDTDALRKALTDGQTIDGMLTELNPKRRLPASVWEAARDKIRRLNPALSSTQADAFAFVKLPILRDHAPSLSATSIKENLLSLSNPPASMAKQFTFEEITYALDGRMSHGDLFNLVDQLEPFINEASPPPAPNALALTVKPETREAYAQWLVEKLGDASPRNSPYASRLARVSDSPIVGEYFSNRLGAALKINEKAAPEQKVVLSATQFFKEIPDSLMANPSKLNLVPALHKWRNELGSPLGFVNQVREAAISYVGANPLPKESSFTANSRARKLMDSVGSADFLSNPDLAASESGVEKIRFFQDTFADSSFPSRKLDDWFERIWHKESANPEFANFFANPQLLKQLSYQDNQIIVARWQLDRIFGLGERSRRLKERGAHFPAKNEVREELPSIIREIEARFPEVSAARNELIDFVQSSLLTSEAESRLLAPLKLSSANWHQSAQVQAIDAPQQVAKMLKTPKEKLSLIRYLIGSEDAPPPIKVQYVDMNESLREARAHFQRSDINVRTYALQPLLDDQTGLLAHPETSQDVYRLVLGDHHEHPLTSKIFHAYLDSLPSSERTAVLGRILASMSGRAEGSASLKSILEAMGPFGIKAGQFLRTTGLLPDIYRRQLDDFFDGARPVPREQIYDRLREVFGKSLVNVEAMGPTVGSGSINYAVLADILDPANSKPKRVVVRVLRDSVEGQVRNENAIWEKVTGKLKADSDPNVRRAASLLEEARAHAFENLRPGGVELDLERARGQEAAARRSYSRSPVKPNGLKLEVAPTVPSIQALIGGPYQRSVSVQEFVPNTRYKDIPLPRRSEVGEIVTRAEMEALFVHGEFDPDGHPGNWLYDEAQHRVVRIDYDQMRKISPQDLPSVRRAFSTLISPDASQFMAKALTKDAESIFRFSKPLAINESTLLSAMTKIVQDPNFPSFAAPHERLLFLQDHLQRELGKIIPDLEVHLRSSIQSSLASLGRIAIYRETIGDVAFGKILLKTLGVNPIAHGWRQVMAGIKGASSATILKGKCPAFFRRFGR